MINLFGISEETLGSVGFESIFPHLEITSNGIISPARDVLKTEWVNLFVLGRDA